MPNVDVLGVQHAYDLTPPVGSGPVLVFVHGWLLSRQYWTPLVDTLSPFYSCLTYDLRGFGESRLELCGPDDSKTAHVENAHVENTHVENSETLTFEIQAVGMSRTAQNLQVSQDGEMHYTPSAYAQDLILLLKRLNISRVWLIGHSLGGSISLWAAALAPQMIEGVVCLNSGGGIYVKEAFDRFRQAGQQMLKFRPAWLPQVPWLDLAFSRMMVTQPLARQWGKQRVADFVAAHPDAALRSLLDSTIPEEVHLLPQVVSKLRQPVMFLAGLQDPVMEPKYVYHLASFHSSFNEGHQNVIEIPNCGHMAMVEQPAAIADHIQKILIHTAVSSPPCFPTSNKLSVEFANGEFGVPNE